MDSDLSDSDQQVGNDSKLRTLVRGTARLESTEVDEKLHVDNWKVQGRLSSLVTVFVVGIILGIVLNVGGNTSYASYFPLLGDVVVWIEGYKALYWRQRWITSTLDMVLGTNLNNELSCVLWGCIVGGTAISLSNNARFGSRAFLELVQNMTFGARPALGNSALGARPTLRNVTLSTRPALVQGSCRRETAVVPAGHQWEQRPGRQEPPPQLELLY